MKKELLLASCVLVDGEYGGLKVFMGDPGGQMSMGIDDTVMGSSLTMIQGSLHRYPTRGRSGY